MRRDRGHRLRAVRDRLVAPLDSLLLRGASAAGASVGRYLSVLDRDRERLALSIGRMESRRVRARTCGDLGDAEFRVFSQFGEDGIVQFLVARVPVSNQVFVEMGVGDYRESNTRFLLQNDLWRGLVIDSGDRHVAFVDASHLRWRHTIEARQAFVTRENVNAVISDAGVTGDIGLLSVDVDGMDYWVLDALEVVSPRIVVAEYNALFGPAAAVTVPYDPAFVRRAAHWSNLYYGASLAAMGHLWGSRGYRLVGCGSAGINAFFVRGDVAGDLPALRAEEAFVAHQHRDSRGASGRLSYVSGTERQLDLIADLGVVDVVSRETVRVGDAVPLVRATGGDRQGASSSAPADTPPTGAG